MANDLKLGGVIASTGKSEEADSAGDDAPPPDDPAPRATPPDVPAGGTAIDENVKIEVDILALGALRKIAGQIASEISGLAEKPSLLIIGGDELILAARVYSGFSARVIELRAELISLLKQVKPPTEAVPGLESITAGLDSASLAVQSLTTLLSFFKAETAYFGRSVELKESALYPALAGQLIARNIPVSVPGYFPMSIGGAGAPVSTVMALLDDLRSLRNHVAAMPADEASTARINALLATVDAAIKAVIKVDPESGKSSALAQLLLGAEYLALMEGEATRLFLSATVISAGGSYRTRKHLFTTLFTGDQLSCSGGAAAGYFAFDLKSSKLVRSDVLYHATGYQRIPICGGKFEPSNIESRTAR
ncbi:hypothetical protein NKJ88_01380 [Mesorhizobium sp. M0016]|uniref:hypothetical protein n=1 Tax=Mesorhizobium sp. M0016 TaxID=2956843 RepID=UPI0033387EAE